MVLVVHRAESCTSELQPLKVNCMVKFGLAWPIIGRPAQILIFFFPYNLLSVYNSLIHDPALSLPLKTETLHDDHTSWQSCVFMILRPLLNVKDIVQILPLYFFFLLMIPCFLLAFKVFHCWLPSLSYWQESFFCVFFKDFSEEKKCKKYIGTYLPTAFFCKLDSDMRYHNH